MNGSGSALTIGRTAMARELARSMDADDAAFAGTLLETFDRSGALVAVKEVASGRYLYVNERMAALFGRAVPEMLAALDSDLLPSAQAVALRSADQTALASDAPAASEHKIDRDGVKREFSVTRMPIAAAGGRAARCVLSVWIEQTQSVQREQQLQVALAQLERQQADVEVLRRELQDQGLRDHATGLYQRPHFDDQLRREVDLSSREHREFALVSIALDPLGDAAQALGGDARLRVLEALGTLLRGNTRAMDASCRLDEDRFAVLLSGVGLATAHSRMEGLRRQCATQIVVQGGRDLGFTVSMGVASFPHTAHSEEELLQAADAALREAQRRGGNHVALASIRFELGA